MSIQAFLLILIVIAGVGVLGFGLSILRSIRDRAKPLVKPSAEELALMQDMGMRYSEWLSFSPYTRKVLLRNFRRR